MANYQGVGLKKTGTKVLHLHLQKQLEPWGRGGPQERDFLAEACWDMCQQPDTERMVCVQERIQLVWPIM